MYTHSALFNFQILLKKIENLRYKDLIFKINEKKENIYFVE